MPQRSLVKIGGSLIGSGSLEQVLRNLLDADSLTHPVFTVGGGPVADQVRLWHQVHNLDEERSHWLALDAVGLNEQLLLNLFPELRLVRSHSQLEQAERDDKTPLICTGCFFKWAEREFGPLLPHNWEVTSDSIALWFADLIDAEDLILVKSVDWPHGITWQQAAAQKLVDPFFPSLVSTSPPVRWLNGRQHPLQIVDCTP